MAALRRCSGHPGDGVAGASTIEAAGAIAEVIPAIIGPACIVLGLMAAIATIVFGAAMMIEGEAIASFYRRRFSREPGVLQRRGPSGGVAAEFLGALAGIVLGILALFGSVLATLLAVAVLGFGAGLRLSCAPMFAHLWPAGGVSHPASEQQTEETVFDSSGQMLAGLASVVLGLLAIIVSWFH